MGTSNGDTTRTYEGPNTVPPNLLIDKTYNKKDRCMYCEVMFDGFCAKAKKDVEWKEMFSPPYKPDWCPGRVPSNEYHD